MKIKVEENKLIKKRHNLARWLLITVAIFLAMIFILGGVMRIYQLNFDNKIYQGIGAGGVDFGGKTKEQAKALLLAKIDGLSDHGIDFEYQGEKKNLRQITIASSGLKATQMLWSYDVNEVADNLHKIGRQGSYLAKIKKQISNVFGGENHEVTYRLKEKETIEVLQEMFSGREIPGNDARLEWQNEELIIIEEKEGFVFDYNLALADLKKNLAMMDRQTINLKMRPDKPRVIKTEAEKLGDQAKEIVAKAPYVLLFSLPEKYLSNKPLRQGEWIINKNKLKELLKIKATEDANGRVILRVGMDEEKTLVYLKEIGKIIEQPAKEARFKIIGEKVVEWQPSEDGYLIDYLQTIVEMERSLIEQREIIISILTLDKSKITNESVNNLGIKELIGTGTSNFAGSPKNRRHNIAVGAKELNGILIKPEEEFSLLGALGEISGEIGYKPELVIREGKTVPEYGGGLCQIGTTMFRLAINAGLPITERRNHSYRVAYYEPAGTDATIYDPWPDLKFKNDTSNYLLLQTNVDGDTVTFDFFGTNDGRIVATSTPIIYNIVRPGEPKIVESDELKPGEKKKMETAHNGADTNFRRIISWPAERGKDKVEEIWESHYVPWREVWLIGRVASTTDEKALEL